MESSGILYRVLYHCKGYIRLEVPILKRLSWVVMFENVKKSLPFRIPAGIRDLHVNPLQGSIAIAYEPGNIDILSYIKNLATGPEIEKIIQDRP
jgi:hypothetical protein